MVKDILQKKYLTMICWYYKMRIKTEQQNFAKT